MARSPTRRSRRRQQFIDNQISGLIQVLNILYVLLALSIVVSLFGIVNTLVLSVFERTREIGMLRAVGTSRRQIRRMIRHESVITALIGSVIGIALGVVFGALLAARVQLSSRSDPGGRLIVFLIAAWLVGCWRRSSRRRAARLSPLQALATKRCLRVVEERVLAGDLRRGRAGRPRASPGRAPPPVTGDRALRARGDQRLLDPLDVDERAPPSPRSAASIGTSA